MLAMPFPNGGEVYVVRKELFTATYRRYVVEQYTPTHEESLSVWTPLLKRAEGDLYRELTNVLAVPPRDDGDAAEVFTNIADGVSSEDITTVEIEVKIITAMEDRRGSNMKARQLSSWGLLDCTAEPTGILLKNDAYSSNDDIITMSDGDDTATLRAKLTKLIRETNRHLADITDTNAKLRCERDAFLRAFREKEHVEIERLIRA